MGVFNHFKQRLSFLLAVDDPLGIENFMPAVFGVNLSKHHKLCVGRIAPGFGVTVAKVPNFLIAKRKTHGPIGLL